MGIGDPLDEIITRYEAVTAYGCCCDDDFCAYVDKKHSVAETNLTENLPNRAASRRGSVRFLNEYAKG